MVTALLEYLDPTILVLLYNLVAVTLLLFKLSQGTAMTDQPIYAPIFKLFLYSVYPVAVTEV